MFMKFTVESRDKGISTFTTASMKEALEQAKSFAENDDTAIIYGTVIIERVWKCKRTGKIRSDGLNDWASLPNVEKSAG